MKNDILEFQGDLFWFSTLQEHLAKHAGDKPYKCEVCPKQFNHKTDLRRHMCLHTGEKPFACEVCGKGFIREDRMVKHSDTHKKKQPILMTWQQMQPEVVSNVTASTSLSTTVATANTVIQLPSSPCWRPGRQPEMSNPEAVNIRHTNPHNGSMTSLWNNQTQQPLIGGLEAAAVVPGRNGLYENICWDKTSIAAILTTTPMIKAKTMIFFNIAQWIKTIYYYYNYYYYVMCHICKTKWLLLI